VAAGSLGSALSTQFSIPGKAIAVSARIAHEFGAGGQTAPLVGVIDTPGEKLASAAYARRTDAVFARMAAAAPGSRLASYATTGDPAFLSADRHTEFALVFPPAHAGGGELTAPQVAAVRRAADAMGLAGAQVHVTGLDALRNTTSTGGGNGVVVEAMLGALGALAVLAFVFASFIALVPLVNAGVAILTTLLIVRGVAAVGSVSMIVEFLIGLIGLGVAIDYSLLVVVRWREERAKGAGREEAVVGAMATAGRAVAFSGLTVAVGLLALIVLPVPFLRSVGVAGMLIPLVSVAVALTLLPVILAGVGPRLDWPHIRHEQHASRGWLAWGRLVVRHRILAAGIGVAILVALVIAATGIRFGNPAVDAIAKAGDAHAGLVALERSGIGAGVLSPIETIAPASSAARTAARFARVHGVLSAVDPSGSQWRRDGQALVDVLPSADPSTDEGSGTLAAVKAAAWARVQIGGMTAGNADFVSAVYGSFPVMIALIAAVTYLLLARAFRSLLLPLKAVVLNVISVAAAWGVMVLVWQDGYGSHALWGIPATGVITEWVPLMMFAFLFGLSMDYEVFILSRTREEYDRTGSTTHAAVHGIARTGRLVTSAALILFLSFVAMATGPQADIKILATGLGAGILLDATVVRALLVPALVSLFGEWNWWLPGRPRRALPAEPAVAALQPTTTQ
ncbi:MAG TPA: MMPL family transporter, partial [Solirubrobacteraceae bacterium]|nr:MMPL family transporter [Solirubrobacteraceae bacterium]